MAFAKVIDMTCGETVLLDGGKTRKVATFYGLTTDGFPEEPAENADKLYYMDWYSISNEERMAAKSQVWMYDETKKKWYPQTNPME